MTEENINCTEGSNCAEEHCTKDPAEHAHHHGWLGKHFCTRNLKKLGALGVVIFALHILFHVVEILLIPAILVWLGLR